MVFVDREQELAFFNRITTRQRPGPAQLILLYGRRRIGKTELLLHWSQQSGLPTTYWTAEKEPAALQRRKLFAALAGTALQYTPIFASWSELWDAAAQIIGDTQRALVLDELRMRWSPIPLPFPPCSTPGIARSSACVPPSFCAARGFGSWN